MPRPTVEAETPIIQHIYIYTLSLLAEVAKHLETMKLAEIFESISWEGSWPEASLEEAMAYLRVSKMVKVPLEFKSLIPKGSP